MTTEMNTNELDNRYAGKGTGTAGLTLGIIGTSLAALGGLNVLNGGIGGGTKPAPAPAPGPAPYVTREEFELVNKIAAKDAQIADLNSEMKDEKKMVEIYTTLATKIGEVNDKVAANRDRADDRLANAVEKLNGKIDFNKNFQDGINAQLLAYNAGNTGTIACMQKQLEQLYSMTSLGVKNSSLCPGVPTVYLTHTNPDLSA